MKTEISLEEYVRIALLLQGMEVKKARLTSITQQFVLLNAMASHFLDEPLPVELESAPIYRL